MFGNRMKVFYDSDGASGGTSQGPTPEQLQQQVEEYKKKYESLQTQVAEGKLVDPNSFLEAKVKNGEIYPKERFTGLQTKFNETQTAYLDLQTKTNEIQSKVSNLEETVKTKTVAEQEKDAELDKLRTATERARVIFSKFPELAPFEAEGLLPVADKDKLPEVFEAFSTKLKAVKDTAAADYGKGGAAPTPPSKMEAKIETAQVHLRKANESLIQGNTVEYEKEYNAYLQALQTKS